MNIKRLFIISSSLLLGLTIILIWLLFVTPILTRAANYTVCPTGPPTCDYNSVQSAVDAAGAGDVIKVAAGTYTGINNKGGHAQVVYIDKSVTIRGGYTTTNWTISDPVANPTTLDAQAGGRVLYITGNISPTIEGLRITGGAPTGVFVDQTAVMLINNTITNNSTGVFLWESDNALVTGNTISNNSNGGGLWTNGDNVTISGNTISNNSADWWAGISVGGQNVRVIGNIISSNTAVNGGGGGSFSPSSGEFIGNIVISNTAGGAGGGLSVSGETSVQTITGNIFSGNSAWEGGALQLGESNTILTNNFIVDNHATGYGSAINIWGVPDSQLLHNTIARNSGGDGSGIHIYESTISMTNNIIADHTVGILVEYGATGATASLESTLWGDGAWANDTDWAGTGTINTTNDLWGNPDFVDPNAGDYHIGSNSAAIDKGVDAGVTNDIDHHPRPYQEPDIGADEYWPPGTLKFIYLPIIMR